MSATLQPVAETLAAPKLEYVPKPQRIESVDLLRGGIMIIMALDHVRDYVYHAVDPVNMQTTFPALFFTRWITHFCAPLFMFLAGTGAFLSLGRGKTKPDLAWFLFSRGVFLLLAEYFIMQPAWNFSFHLLPIFFITLSALGTAMIFLAGAIFFPRWLVVTVCSALVLFHNVFDNYHAASWGHFYWVWALLHEQSFIKNSHGTLVLLTGYPIIPWIGVMPLGYYFGSILKMETAKRQRALYTLGGSLTAAFFVVRGINVYGDPLPWHVYPTAAQTVMSFFNCTKYPPSLDYLLMTIGPGITMLPLLENVKNRVSQWVMVFGRVPMFYYVLHVYVVHAVAVGLALAFHKPAPWTPLWFFDTIPANFGFSLWVVYGVWIAIIIALYPACRWYADLKKRRKDWWLGYL
jgi:uncharacterized membrane protein